jgi:hypothetical protein
MTVKQIAMLHELQLCTHGHIQDKFSQSIKDNEFDGMHDRRKPRTWINTLVQLNKYTIHIILCVC